MEKIAVFPGSFDPVTLGHESIVLRSLDLFDKIIIAIGKNSGKHTYFSLETRLEFLRTTFASYPKVDVVSFEGLTVDFCRKVNARFILRGLRTSADFEFERGIAQMNKKMHPHIDTVFLLSTPDLTPVNSTIIRDIYRNGGDITQFVPKTIIPLIEKFMQ